MAGNKKISELSTAGTLTGAELVEIVQSGGNVKVTTQDIADLGAAGSGITGIAPVGNLLRVLTVDGGGNVVTVEASNIYEDSVTIQAQIDGGTITWGAYSSITGDSGGAYISQNTVQLDVNAARLKLRGIDSEIELRSVSLNGLTSAIVGIDAAGKLFRTSITSGLNPDGSDIGATAEIQRFDLGIGDYDASYESTITFAPDSITLKVYDVGGAVNLNRIVMDSVAIVLYSGTQNYIEIDSDLSVVRIHSSEVVNIGDTGAYVVTRVSDSTVSIGDFAGAANSTYIINDDANQRITLNSDTIVVNGDTCAIGTFANPTSITVVNGLITAIS